MDAVSQVLTRRAQPSEGLSNMLAASLLAHLALIVVLVLSPAWWGTPPTAAEEAVMVISLGGAPGPATGMTTLGGRPVQEQIVEPKKAIEPVRPPAAKAPEMIEPTKKAPRARDNRAQTATKDPRSRTPTRGEEVREGTAVAETGGRGQGFGLSAGGGGVGGYLDVANFCCPEYLGTMVNMIRNNWQSRQQASGTVVMKFVIQRDGRLTGVEVERSSGYPALDLLAQRALLLTRQLPPLPPAFPEPQLTVHLVFEYQR